MLKRFISYYKPHKLIFSLDMLASLLIALIGIVYPMVTKKMLQDLIPNKNYRMIIIAGLVLLAIYFIRMMLNYFIQYYGHVMGVRMQAQMRSDMFNHLEKLPYSFYDNNETGKIMSRMTNDLMDISELAHHGPENIIISSISVIISFVYLCTIDTLLTLIVFSCVPFLLITSLLLRKKMRNAFMKSRLSIAEINSSLEGSISGIRVTKAFTNAEKEKEKFEEGNEKFVDSRKEAYDAMGRFHSTNSFITDVFNVVILIAGGLFMYSERIGFPDYSAFVVSVHLFITPIMTLINFMEQYQSGVTGFERFIEIMDAEPEKDVENAIDLEKVEGHIELRNVEYSYDEEKEVLRGINLSIEKGKKFALVGPSGGGKTTICHLIPHFYDIHSGDILIDGQSINTLTRESVRKNIGIVQQDVFLFVGTIRDNITYGASKITKAQLAEVIKMARLEKVVEGLPNGLDTSIGEHGSKLSGGQRQRIAIARAIIRNPSVIIFDEATSALDNESEFEVAKSLEALSEGRTTVTIAHRLSTIKNSDRIMVLTEEGIVEEGNHETLLERKGLYYKFYQTANRLK